MNNPSTQPASSPFQPLVENIKHWVFGLEEPLKNTLIALLCGGHVLYEGPPGTAKTLMAKLLAQSMHCPFKRIPFTPDMMPSDIIGTNIFNQEKHAFQFNPGPVFTTFLLADEINRAPAKTQAALLEAMQEHQVTVDGTAYKLSEAFTVMATQNPLEQEGTYPLPEAQLDRFLFKINFPYPSREAELHMLRCHHGQSDEKQPVAVPALLQEADLLALRSQANNVEVQDSILGYVTEFAEQSRKHPRLAVGLSPRASVLWIKAAKAKAFLEGRNYVIPDDIKTVSVPLLQHRLVAYPQAELEGSTVTSIIEELLLTVKPPR